MATQPEIETRSLILSHAELRASKSDSGKLKIEGYAAKFGTFSETLGFFEPFKETLDRNAFEKCLERCDVRALENHDSNRLLGRSKNGTLRLKTNDTGLYFECDLPDTQQGRDTHSLVSDGYLDGCSFSFTTDVDKWDYSGAIAIRTVIQVRDLYDVGPVTYPAYIDTSVAARSLEQARLAATPRNPRRLQSRLLRLRLGRFKT